MRSAMKSAVMMILLALSTISLGGSRIARASSRPRAEAVDLAALQPGLTDRALFAGMTESGKTTLAQYLLIRRPYVVALDTKGALDWGSRWHLHTRFSALQDDKHSHLIYRPPYREVLDHDAMDRFFAWIWLRKNTTAYVDELLEITDRQEAPFHLRQNYQRGRSPRKIAMWAGVQRPSLIPTYCMSEAQAWFVFYLGNADDRDRVEDYAPALDADDIGALRKHEFLVYHAWDRQAAGPYRLNIPRPATAAAGSTRQLRIV